MKGFAINTLWWIPSGKAFGLLAQGGVNTSPVASDLPAGVQWTTFNSLAVAGGRGPIFAATLALKKNLVTTTNSSGVWAMDYLGTLRTLFRTGDQLDLGTPGHPLLKKVKSFKLLTSTVGNAGVTRSFNDNAEVVWLATFTDKLDGAREHRSAVTQPLPGYAENCSSLSRRYVPPSRRMSSSCVPCSTARPASMT
ncbi:MAG TPA: hypothetical protein VGO11_02925 [Chthoniobacteraceae bacterium]|nr:hypothetical protein [Chthoniobacteraceae bacterium]